ncbi:MAG: hypothetical protein LBG60_17245 [Bifidobacteriaceae bacterium]|jgi:hypothetical protein|nr:hypothetical protein [Bifidobacteriaceae bacterium]
MKRITVAGAIRAANPLDPARAAEPLDARARAQLASYVHPSLWVSDDAAPAPRRRPARTAGLRWSLAGAVAAAAAAAAVVLVPNGGPPAQAGVTTGRVLAVTERTEQGTAGDWTASAIAELTSPEGDKRLLRAWSKSGGLDAAEGARLVYEDAPRAGWLELSEGRSALQIVPLASLDGFESSATVSVSGEGGGSGEVVSGAAGSGFAAGGGSGAAAVVIGPDELAAAAFGPVAVDGAELWASLVARDGDTFFYVQAVGDDLDKARSLLEGLRLGPDGNWSQGAAPAGLAGAAAAEDLVGQVEVLGEGPDDPDGTVQEESQVSRVAPGN